jgi:hypothetical protein
MSSFLEKKLIIIPFDLPKNWSADYITQTAQLLAKKNQVIGFLWEDALSIKEIILKKINHSQNFRYLWQESGIIYLKPIHFLPFRRFSFVNNINLLINITILKWLIVLKGFNQKEKIIWLFHSNFWFLPNVFGKNFMIIYDCVDFLTSENKEKRQRIKRNEQKLLKKADKVFVNSKVLLKDKRKYRQNIHLLPQGFSLKIFQSPKKLPSKNLIFKIKRPLIGYIGGINYRLDYTLLINLANKNPNFSFLFIGPFQKDPFIKFEKQLEQLKKMKNVYFQEFEKKEYIPSVIKHFDICLIPYNISQDFNKYCYPMKIFEYFYLGKPVISTPIEELKQFSPLVKIASDTNSFNQAIKEILKKAWPKTYAQKQKELAIANSWVNKIKKIDQVLYKNNA